MQDTGEGRKPLIHCITNPIAMNQSANAILALGARPIMAEHPLEVADITKGAEALLLNLGNISDSRMEAMKVSIAVANDNRIPVVFDLVGVACSKLRRDFTLKLLEEHTVNVIKGNYSEIINLYDGSHTTDGVDKGDIPADIKIDDVVKKVAMKYKTIVLATGSIDIISDGNQLDLIRGGCDQMAMVTGTGCMLGAVIATFLANSTNYETVKMACQCFKECGEKSYIENRPGTFMVRLLDNLCISRGE